MPSYHTAAGTSSTRKGRLINSELDDVSIGILDVGVELSWSMLAASLQFASIGLDLRDGIIQIHGFIQLEAEISDTTASASMCIWLDTGLSLFDQTCQLRCYGHFFERTDICPARIALWYQTNSCFGRGANYPKQLAEDFLH